MDAAALVRPIVERGGLEVLEVGFRHEAGRQVLRVTVDGEDGVDLETLSHLSDAISRRLDLEDFGTSRYALEVSSPGIERPLLTPSHYARFLGSRVKIMTTVPVEGATTHTGTLLQAASDRVVIAVEDVERTILLADVVRARTVADWAAELKERTA
ncbi:MAG: ribosome maturation factor RimP [Actinomycetota bacterium]